MIFSLQQQQNPSLLPACSTKTSLLEEPLFQSGSLLHTACKLKMGSAHLKPPGQHRSCPCLLSCHNPGNPQAPRAAPHLASLPVPCSRFKGLHIESVGWIRDPAPGGKKGCKQTQGNRTGRTGTSVHLCEDTRRSFAVKQ